MCVEMLDEHAGSDLEEAGNEPACHAASMSLDYSCHHLCGASLSLLDGRRRHHDATVAASQPGTRDSAGTGDLYGTGNNAELYTPW